MSHNTVFIRMASILAASAILSAQVRYTGNVQDPQGRAIDGAELTLFRDGAGAPIATANTTEGMFALPPVPEGRYLLQVAAPGFRTASLNLDKEISLTVKLDVAGIDSQVLVTAEAVAQTFDHVSKAATTIDSQEIAQRNEYSISEALRNTPGLLVRNLGGPGQSTTVRLRGLRADATAVLIDGLRFRDVATTQADASSFLSSINVINLDRVEVLRGSGSSLYGTNAVGGTVNIVTDPGGGNLHGGLQLEGGTLGLMRGRATAAGGLFDNRLAFSGGLLHLNVLSGVDGDDRARSSGFQTFTRYSFTPGASLSGRVFFSDDFVQPNLSPTASGIPAANIPNATIVPAIALAPDQVKNSAQGLPIVPGNATFIPNRNDPDNRRASRFWTGALTFRQALHSTADWQLSYQRVHTDRSFENGPAGAGFQPTVSNHSGFTGNIDTVDARLNWRPASWYALSGGYEFEREGYLNVDRNNLPPPGTVDVRTETGQRANAGYFANQLTLFGRRVQVSASGRAQAFRLDQPRFIYTGTVDNYSRVPVTSPPRALTGDVAVSYFAANTGTKLRAHGGNSYRAPGLYERYGSGFFYDSTSNSVAFSPYGDPRLSPDRYNSVDAGIDQYLMNDRIRLSATWFYTRIVQITQFDSAGNVVKPATDPFGRTSGYYNGAGGTSRGAELSAEMRPMRSAIFRAAYSYVNADTDQDTAVRGFFRALSVPAHSVCAMWNQQLGRKTDFTADLYHSSDYFNALSAAGRARAYDYPGVTKIDFVVSRQVWESDRHALRAYAKVDNVLNQRYFENGFQGPRATFLTGVQVLFK